MLRQCLSMICVIALVTVNSAPSFAAGEFELYSVSQYTGIDTYQRSAELTAGLYLRVPFSGGLRRSVDETRFGLSFGARAPSYDRLGGRPLLLDRPQLFDLSVGLQGKESLRIDGLNIDMPTLYADGDEEFEKEPKWLWVLVGVGVLFIASAVAALVTSGTN